MMNLTARRWPVTGYILKWIAIVTMLIDHTGHVCYKWLGFSDSYLLLRRIGRIAFPIFVFLLIEGARHTRNRWKYLQNMLLFALISEIPFDLALTGWEYRDDSQNIYWTLALGLLGVMVAEETRKGGLASRLTALASMAALVALGQFAHVDYDLWGVLLVALVYGGERLVMTLTKQDEPPQFLLNCGAAAGVILWASLYDIFDGWIIELYGLVAVIPILLYNGERGRYRLSKWFFYGFYPVHLLLLYALQDTLFQRLLT